jgi:tRNA pseudouridine38-40 synthase
MENIRVKIIFSYNGTFFFGSQEQKNTDKTIATTFNNVLKKININNKIVMSSRTDKRVHALWQVAHLDIPKYWDIHKLKHALNKRLNQFDIYIKNLKIVSNDFHARFSAKKRIYYYVFSFNTPNPFQKNYVTFLDKNNLDLDKIKNGIQVFEGVHNFQFFKKNGSSIKSNIRTIYNVKFLKRNNFYILRFCANGFLRSQIRFMVGALIALAYGKITLTNIRGMLELKAKQNIKPAPPNGLYLAKILY